MRFWPVNVQATAAFGIGYEPCNNVKGLAAEQETGKSLAGSIKKTLSNACSSNPHWQIAWAKQRRLEPPKPLIADSERTFLVGRKHTTSETQQACNRLDSHQKRGRDTKMGDLP